MCRASTPSCNWRTSWRTKRSMRRIKREAAVADEFSFDVVSKVDLQGVDDAVNAVNREIAVRFDFRGSVSRVELDKIKAEITLHSDDEGKLKSVTEILITRLVKRNVDPKSLDY